MRDSIEPQISKITSDNIELKLRNSINNLEQHPAKKTIITISELLNNMCNENNSTEVNNKNIELNKRIKFFMLKKIPSITIKEYLFRLTKYSKICESTLVMILIYIDRLCHRYKFKITFFNIYKLILSAMIISIKYNEDEFYTSDFYAKLGGISTIEMNTLEYEFAGMIHFNLFISQELFFKYYELLSNSTNGESKKIE